MRKAASNLIPHFSLLLFFCISLLIAVIVVQYRTYLSPHASTGINNPPLLQNAINYLTTPTYDNSGQAVHLDVVYIPGGWQGYSYWMVMTPYPYSNDQLENPSVLVSTNGLNWTDPGHNPVAPNPNTSSTAYFQSDPDMLLVNNRMYIYYRTSIKSSNQTTLNYITSVDGRNWTAPQSAGITQNGNYFASPSVVYQNGFFYLFYVDTIAQTVHRLSSATGTGNWAGDTVVLSFPYAWHVNIIPYQNHYLMLMVEKKPTNKSSLYYFYSENMLNWTLGGQILSPSATGWDSTNIYRSAFIIDGTRFRVWYSAFFNNIPHIGYAEDPNWSYITISAPSCNSWTDFYINSCDSFTDFNNNAPNCNTRSAVVTLHVYGLNVPTKMKFYNMPDPNAYCTSLSGNESGWSSPQPYRPSATWTLSPGTGIKKVCTKLYNSLGWSWECGGEIRLNP